MIAAFLFWSSLALIAYAYFGYPLLLAVWPWKRAPRRGRFEPTISIVIAAHNERDQVVRKVEHLLGLPYPAAKREIIVVSDASTDGTADALEQWAGRPDVRTIAYDEHRGKAYALNCGVAMASGEIVVFNDARQKLAPEALGLLLENFADPDVGCVSGELRFESESRPSLKTTLYWKYERWLRRTESLTGACIGGTGAFCAIRRELFRPLPQGLILDDVYTPAQIALAGWRVIHDDRAVVIDREASDEGREFRRKVRTLSGNYQLVQRLPGLLAPSRLAFQFASHKLLRLAVPFAMITALAANCFLGGAFYGVLLAGQIAFYAATGCGLAMRNAPKILSIPTALVLLNAAAAVAFWNFVTGRNATWKGPATAPESPRAVDAGGRG